MKSLFFTGILLFTGILFSQQLNAQENDSYLSNKKIELGVSYSGKGIGLDVKRHWKDNKYIRLSNARIGLGVNSEPKLVSLETGFNIGIENRKYLSNKWWLSHGPEMGAQFGFYNTQNLNQYFYELSLGYFLGINYDITNNLSIGAEVKTSIYANKRLISGPAGISPLFRTQWGIRPTAKMNLMYRF